ncbi:MAG: hypothetical protein ABI784_02570 [Ginsengibacter sp.]
MFFWNKVCASLFFFFFISSTSFSQLSADNRLKDKAVFQKQLSFSTFTVPKRSIIKLNILLPTILKPDLKITPDQVSCKYGFFCKNEWKLEKTTRLPFRFRVGSLEQCDFYENRK